MSNSPEMALLYKHVIEDVIRNVRAEFINIGVDEQQWESKLLESKVIRPEHFPISSSTSFAQQHQQPYEYHNHYYQSDTINNSKFKTPNGAPLTSSSMSLPKQGENSTPPLSQEEQNIILQQQMRHLHSQQEKKKSTSPPQYDGANDSEVLDEVDLINSDLDDSDEEVESALMSQGVSDILLCQFEKVTRVKSRWRGILRSGLININGCDLAFGKCNLDFQW